MARFLRRLTGCACCGNISVKLAMPVRLHVAVCALSLVALSPISCAAAVTQQYFASPQDGVAALVEAVRLNSRPMLQAALGSHADALTRSGDAVDDERSRNAFVRAYDESNRIALENGVRAMLVIGKDEWPLPIPLLKTAAGWRFDTHQGEKEILRRRIGRNELAAIRVCRAIVDAEREYAAQFMKDNGVAAYASRFMSTAGRRDGLYWQTQAGEQPSPLGPLLAKAASEGYARAGSEPLAPYHGYLYKILAAQGQDAPGGAYDYVVKGRMIGGFAVIAYPARYGVSGVMSFIVNQNGEVHEKDLGRNTASLAVRMSTYNPDAGWKQHP